MKNLLLTATLCFAATANAYTPPIGVPDPKWENSIHPIDTAVPNRPSNWTRDIKGFYYVDPDHAQATDSKNTYGYPNKPRKTIPKIVAAGSYVEISGRYNQDAVYIKYNCTPSAPCWLVGNKNDRPNFTGNLKIDDSDYLIIDSVDFVGGGGTAVSIKGSSHHIAYRHSKIADREQYLRNNGGWQSHVGVSIKPDDGDTISDIVVYGNTFSKLGEYSYTGKLDPNFHAVGPTLWNSSGVLKDVWVLNNFCSLLAGDCVQINAGNQDKSWERLHHIYVGKNISSETRQGGIGVKQSSDVIISQNKFYGFKGAGAGNAGGGIVFKYEKRNLWIIFNEVFDSNFGIRQANTGDKTEGEEVHIIGNLIYNIKPVKSDYNPIDPWSQGVAIALHRGHLDRYIVDNTIHNVSDGINIINDGGVDISGNILSDIGESRGNRFFMTGTAGNKNHVSMDYNLFYDDARQEYLHGANRNQSVDNIEDLRKKVPSFCKLHCDFTRPGFVKTSKDSSAQDFRITASSAAAGKNRRHYSYDRFEQLYGIDIYKDFNGKSRLVNTAIGAFEVDSTFEPKQPSKSSDPINPADPVVVVDSDAEPIQSKTLAVEIAWPSKKSTYYTNQRKLNFGGRVTQSNTLKNITWRCARGCRGSGNAKVYKTDQNGVSNWQVKDFTLGSTTNVVEVIATNTAGEVSKDRVVFKLKFHK